jgi:hypothetical protein
MLLEMIKLVDSWYLDGLLTKEEYSRSLDEVFKYWW